MFSALRDSTPYYTFKRILRTTFLLSLSTFVFLSFYKPPLPKSDEIVDEVKNNEPVQSEIEAEETKNEIIKIIGEYEYHLKPLYEYELTGLIVTDYNSDNWLDVRHEDDPGNIKDICVVWGENIKNGSFREVKYKSGEFTCFYRWNKKLEQPFLANNLSNNHLIPLNENIARRIKSSKVGDQVSVKGSLVNYEIYRDGKMVFSRKTSTKRDDTRNGACEIIYVNDFEVIRKNLIDYGKIREVSGYLSLISGVLGILLFILI